MSILPDQDNIDPWTLLDAVVLPEQERPVLRVEIIDGVEPLDAQIGVFPKKAVPDALHDALFGQPVLTAAETKSVDDDPAAVPPLHTYAILDAAKVTNLPELLERSGLEHRCLFKGNTFDELKHVAPWIVRLEERNSFTRNLFTRSKAHWHLWDDAPGLHVRSDGTLDQLWKHFRKFTRIRDENGKWFHLRFWSEPFLSALRDDALTKYYTVLQAPMSCALLMFIGRDREGIWWPIRLCDPVAKATTPMVLTSLLRTKLNLEVMRRQAEEELAPTLNSKSINLSECAYDLEALFALRQLLIDKGFKQAEHRRALFKVLYDKGFMRGSPWPRSLQDLLSDTSRGAGIRLWLLENRTYK